MFRNKGNDSCGFVEFLRSCAECCQCDRLSSEKFAFRLLSRYCDDKPERFLRKRCLDVADLEAFLLHRSYDSTKHDADYVAAQKKRAIKIGLYVDADASGGEGIMEFSNNMPDLTASGYFWKGWFSVTPGGTVLNDNAPNCRRYSPNPNPIQLRWSQAGDPNQFACNLGQTQRVLYFNMGVECYEEPWTLPADQRNCTVGDEFPGVGGFDVYYIKVYPR